MEVSPNALRKEAVATLREVEELLDGPTQLEASVKAPLLLAKAQCLNVLVLLNTQERTEAEGRRNRARR